MSAEQWRWVVGEEGRYEVSDQGRVRSVERTVRCRNRWGKLATRTYPGRLRKPGSARGYLYVPLGRRGNVRTVHRMVLEAFVGRRPKGKEAAHKNGVRSDNRLGNLEWKTRSANNLDKWSHGTMLHGERHPNAKLSARAVQRIKRLAHAGAPRKVIALLENVSVGHVNNILRGKRRAIA